MAKFTAINAANVAELGIAEISAITPEDKRTILMAGATVLRDGMQNYLQQHHNRTGELAGSITITDHIQRCGELWVEPSGAKNSIASKHGARKNGKPRKGINMKLKGR